MALNREQLEHSLRLLHCGGANVSASTFAPPPFAFAIHLFDEVASTNQTLWNLLAAGAPAGTVAIASRQTAGKGQWGRQWQSDSGGLYLSLALEPNISATNALLLTLCSAWGIAQCLRSHQIPVFLKWPNDLILRDRKLGGILTETKIHQGKIAKAVVGVGINWINPVPETGINLHHFLSDCPQSAIPSLEMLAALTLSGIASGYQTFSEEGVETLLPSYRELMVSIGQPVTIDGCGGVVVGVSATGELRVRRTPSTTEESNNFAGETASEICLMPGTIALGYQNA